jgi:hypothetical protein
MDDREQEAFYEGVGDIIIRYDDNESIFYQFRNDTEFKRQVTGFINRGGVDVCYCFTGGNRCHQCCINEIISRHLIGANEFYLVDFLVFILCICERLSKRIGILMERYEKYVFANAPKGYRCRKISTGELEKFLKSVRSIIGGSSGDFSVFEHLRNNEWLCEHIIKSMVRWAISSSPCSALGHDRYTCFLGNIPSRIILSPGPIRREELILVLFHLIASFRERIAEFIIRHGTGSCYCWNYGGGCTYAFVHLDFFT